MQNITIKVKQYHIDDGVQGDPNTCAIAEAIKEQLGIDEVSVDSNEIIIEKSNGFSFKLTWKKIPKYVQSFIEKFDDDKDRVKPFSFKLPFNLFKK